MKKLVLYSYVPIRFVIILLVPVVTSSIERAKKMHEEYRQIARSISTLMSNDVFNVSVYLAEGRDNIIEAVDTFLDESLVLPPGQLLNPNLLKDLSKYQRREWGKEHGLLNSTLQHEDHDIGLKITYKMFAGLKEDVKRKMTKAKFVDDWCDGWNKLCVFGSTLLFLVSIIPALAFGDYLEKTTLGEIGVKEMILATGIASLVFSIFGGQPLMILGGTGSKLVYEKIVYKFCLSRNLNYLHFRALVSVWIGLLTTVAVCFELPCYVRYFTTFSEDILAVVIGVVFIHGAFKSLYANYWIDIVNGTNVDTGVNRVGIVNKLEVENF